MRGKICACTHCILKGQGVCYAASLPVFVVSLWVRCSPHRPCFSMGRSLSSDRKSTILSGKWEGQKGREGFLGDLRASNSFCKIHAHRPPPNTNKTVECEHTHTHTHTCAHRRYSDSSISFSLLLQLAFVLWLIVLLSTQISLLVVRSCCLLFFFSLQVSTDCLWLCLDQLSLSNYS